MATINYNGMVLDEFTSDTPVFWDTPRKALCWNEDNNHYRTEEYLIGYVPRSDDGLAISDHTTWSHCALLPEKPVLHKVTNRELAEWLARGNGQVSYFNEAGIGCVSSSWTYMDGDHASPTSEGDNKDLTIRRWGDDEWHEPTTEYMEVKR